MTRIFKLCTALEILSESPFWLIPKTITDHPPDVADVNPLASSSVKTLHQHERGTAFFHVFVSGFWYTSSGCNHLTTRIRWVGLEWI
jgi:hypothetical protein